MSSILTNNGAMVALQTLKSINGNLATTQAEISTGKSVANAKDNAAVWAISKTMEADVKGFKGISDSLNLGESTVAVARQAAETVTDLLTEVKGKIVAAQEENVDRDKIQVDIDALRDQISAVVGAAQFNGLNLIDNTNFEAGTGSVNVLASLDRSATGVAASDINVAKQDLGTSASSISATGGTYTEGTGADQVTLNVTTTGSMDLGTNGIAPTAGTGYAIRVVGAGTLTGLNTTGANTQAGMATTEIKFVARDGDTMDDVAAGLEASFNQYLADEGIDAATLSVSRNGDTLSFAGGTDGTNTIQLSFDTVVADATTGAGTTIGGRLEALSDIDVTTQSGVDAALTSIEGLIQTAIDSASSFGSVQGRIETQTDFISGLTDALKSGIGTLVDADMEEASARLQALQVQQQLGVQALSIANQAPQSLLSLFR